MLLISTENWQLIIIIIISIYSLSDLGVLSNLIGLLFSEEGLMYAPNKTKWLASRFKMSILFSTIEHKIGGTGISTLCSDKWVTRRNERLLSTFFNSVGHLIILSFIYPL